MESYSKYLLPHCFWSASACIILRHFGMWHLKFNILQEFTDRYLSSWNTPKTIRVGTAIATPNACHTWTLPYNHYYLVVNLVKHQLSLTFRASGPKTIRINWTISNRVDHLLQLDRTQECHTHIQINKFSTLDNFCLFSAHEKMRQIDASK